MVRTGTAAWGVETAPGLIALERQKLDAAGAHGLFGWLWLGDLTGPAFPAHRRSRPTASVLLQDGRERPQGAPGARGLEGRRRAPPDRGNAWIRPAGLYAALSGSGRSTPGTRIVMIQAPGGPVAQLVPYRPAFDITAWTSSRFSYPPGMHGGKGNKAVWVVGDWAR